MDRFPSLIGKHRHFSDSDRLPGPHTPYSGCRKLSNMEALEDTLASLNQRISVMSLSSRPALDSWESEYSSGYDEMSLQSGSSVDSCFSSEDSLDYTVIPNPRDEKTPTQGQAQLPDFSGRPDFLQRSFSTPNSFPSVPPRRDVRRSLRESVTSQSSNYSVIVSAQLKDPSKKETGWRTWLRGQSRLSLRDNSTRNKTKLTVFDEGGGSHAVLVDEKTTAGDLVKSMVARTQSKDSIHWSIIEDLDLGRAERLVEDHEQILSIRTNWTSARMNKIVFKNEPRKNDPFMHPERLFSEHMKDQKSDRKRLTADAERAREILMMDLVAESDRTPDLQGKLHLKLAGESKWRKAYCYLRGSGLHYSTKGKTQDPKHLRCFCRLEDVDIFLVRRSEKKDKLPTRHCLMLKNKRIPLGEGIKEVGCICAKDEESFLTWLSGLRIGKFGPLLRHSFKRRLGSADITFLAES
ncbi:amyloid beta A4 precursor protein-binding family B member 1-interacting protein-like [Liolophura sinensis]|uniref:amyloid beta A4 precursor protein-binding family B member 1-interacting protein-like n=1 Tax=Liolophura sinensis TaxID=3198878 RepID=UPI00315897B0